MSAETAIAVGVSSRVLANVACTSNPRLGAAVVGCGTGFILHQSWVKHTIQDPLMLLIIASGLVFDHFLFGGFEGTITLLLAIGLGVVLADFGPDLLYEVLGEQYARDLENLFPSFHDDPVSDYDDGSVVSKASSHRTSRTGTSVTVRPSRPRVVTAPSVITRSSTSRVTFDESSMAQSQSSDGEYENNRNGDGLYMEPSSMTSGSSRTRVTMQPPPSILRRMSMPTPATTTTGSSVPSEVSHHTQLTTESETPRGQFRQLDERAPPFEARSELQPPSFPFPEPETSNAHVYSPRVVPPSDTTPDMSASVPLSEPMQNDRNHAYQHAQPQPEPHEPSLLERMMNVPIVDPHLHPESHPESAEPSQARPRSRPSSLVRPESILSPQVQTPPPALHDAMDEAWVTVPEPYVPDNYEDRTIDVRKLDRETALARIEEAWKTVENRKHRRLNVLVDHDDEVQLGKDSNFRLIEELEKARFNFKMRPGLFIVTSRSRR